MILSWVIFLLLDSELEVDAPIFEYEAFPVQLIKLIELSFVYTLQKVVSRNLAKRYLKGICVVFPDIATFVQ